MLMASIPTYEEQEREEKTVKTAEEFEKIFNVE